MPAFRVFAQAANKKGGFGKQPANNPSKPKKQQQQQTGNTLSAEALKAKTPEELMMAQRLGKLPDEVNPQKVEEEKEFEERLRLAAEKGKLIKKEIESVKESGSILTTEINYDQPPSISETLSKAAASSSLPGMPTTTTQAVGPGQAFAGAIAIVMLAVFIATNSGSDLQMQTQSYLPNKGGQTELSSEEKDKWTARETEFKARLAENADDREALEGLAVSYAELRQYKDAEATLTKLTGLPDASPDAYRLLGEVQALQGNSKGAAASYKKGVEASGNNPSLELLQGLSAAYVKENRAADAISIVQGVKAALPENADVGTVEIDLLIGKIYSQWAGHTRDAEAVYNALIQNQPDDFRGYLAKAVLFKEEGRKADAERLFIQSQFYAPTKEAKALVARISGRA